jgi:hypothetical protein
MSRWLVLAAATATLLAAAPAPAAENPADALLSVPIERSHYDPATRCSAKPKPGMQALIAWMGRNARGVSWGTYRCELWGKHSASLHAEGRALDWHLDVTNRADRKEAERLIGLFLAPDAAGNTQALARRMGIEELIWDCGYWAAGMTEFQPYSPCYTRRGHLRKHVDPTIAHRNHIHIGMTKDGAAKRTSFWTRKPALEPAPFGGTPAPGADDGVRTP